VHAVEVLFTSNGDYLEFNQQSSLARNGGKAEICAQLNKAGLKMAMIGDGNTDMEAKKAGAYCIGFGVLPEPDNNWGVGFSLHVAL
jgi:phosphoserine phosphatase